MVLNACKDIGLAANTRKTVYSLYHSPNIVRMIKSRRLRWAAHVTRMEDAVGMLSKF